LSINLLISKIIILKNDPLGRSNKSIKTPSIGKKDFEEIEKIIDYSYKYRDHILELKDYFDQIFNKAKIEKVLLNFDKKLTNICIESKYI
jgi:hypothetical protein